MIISAKEMEVTNLQGRVKLEGKVKLENLSQIPGGKNVTEMHY